MEEHSEDDEWCVNGWQVAGEPLRQVDVGDGAALGPERLGEVGEGTAEAVSRKDQALSGHDGARDGGSSIGALREPRV